jgi:hypothetical protein
MPEEKEISYSVGSGTINTTKKRRQNRRVTRSVEKAGMKGEEIVKTEQIQTPFAVVLEAKLEDSV